MTTTMMAAEISAILRYRGNEMERPYHPAANLFPLMDGEPFRELVADVAANGLMEPIWIDGDGAIVDGRNRHRACIEADVRPAFRVWKGSSLVQFVVSMNLHRRHLSSSQRAVVALDILPMLEEEARERQGQRTDIKEIIPESNGQARDHAAEIVQTNGRYVQDAKKLQEEAPELLEQVRSGEMTIPKAMEAHRQATASTNGYSGNGRYIDVHYSSATPEHETPADLFAVLDVEFAFTLDVCATADNAKCAAYFSPEDDGLKQDWGANVCWMNPPYGDAIKKWVKKAHRAAQQGATVVCLVPSRTDTGWWWDYCIRGEVRFIKGRLRFGDANNSAPFPSAVIVFGPGVEPGVRWWADAQGNAL